MGIQPDIITSFDLEDFFSGRQEARLHFAGCYQLASDPVVEFLQVGKMLFKLGGVELCLPIFALFDVGQVDASLNADDIEKISTRFSDYLDGLYQNLINVAEIVEVKELFENMLEQQQQERKKLSTDLYSLLDM